MKANDIQIGDYLRRRYTCTDTGREVVIDFQVTEIRKNGDSLYVCSEKGVVCKVEDAEPIPLTPEILEKNGFKIDKNETYCKRYFFACNLNKVPQTVVEFSFYGEGVSADTLFKCWTKPESCDGENSIHICDLKSVHQFQSALRLCGIDKEIKI